jgi:alpha-glucosidase
MSNTILRSTLFILLTVTLALAGASRAQQPRGPRGDEEGGGGRRTQRVVPLEEVEVSSPDGRVKFTVLSNAERLSYKVTMGDVTVIDPSPIVVDVDGFDLASGVVFKTLERYEIDETYPWHGVHSTAVNKCNGAKITFAHDLSFAPHVLEIRAFNAGVAFRHIVPGDEDVSRVPNEFTKFIVPAGSRVWFHNLDGHYEAPYIDEDIADVKAGQWAGPPVTFRLPDGKGYGVITEANLVDYSGMALECDGRRGWIVGLGHRHPINYPFELRYGREEGKRLGKPAAVAGTITTPWRVVLAAPNLNGLVNSDIIPSLCPPPDKKLFPDGMETSWVEPGLAVWRYVDEGDNTFEGLKEFSRMAGELGAKYHIIEGMWSRWTPEQIREIVEYSKQHGVRLVFWRHSNRLRTPEAREEFFKLLHDNGVAGAKIDFFDHEAKESVDLYEELLKKAAEYQIVIDFHGANKPTGRMRTWPNDMIREAVRGMESRSMRERARHQTILPFTRYLAGPADYTTMIFNERRGDSTWAHQIASLATLDSPMLTIAAHPQNVLNNPAADVIKSIAPVWDETIVLPDSKIGELSVFARRKGTMWMLAVMCGPQPQKINVPLSFLGDGTYKASIVRDDNEKDDAVTIEDKTVQRGDSLAIDLRRGGGFLARFSKE